jgi:hypothetical protein
MRRVVVTLTACSVIAAATGALPAGAFSLVPGKTLIERWNGSTWSKTTSPSPAGGDVLNGVDAVGPSDAWAVGQHGKGSAAHPLLERWSGSTWAVVQSDATPGGSWLDDVAMITASDGWAVGHGAFGQDGQPIVMHWDGAKWLLAADPSVPGGELRSVDGFAPDDLWAVGDAGGATLTEHWDGTEWKVVNSPSGAGMSTLHGITVIAPDDAWAVGSAQQSGRTPKALIEHWDGTKWSIVKSTSLPGSELRAVSARASDDVFAAGDSMNAKGCLRTLVLRWTGSGWKQMTTPNPFRCDNELAGLDASSQGVLAVGNRPDQCPGSHCRGVTLALRLVNGSWKVQASPNTSAKFNQLLAVGLVPGVEKPQAWAVGIATSSFQV